QRHVERQTVGQLDAREAEAQELLHHPQEVAGAVRPSGRQVVGVGGGVHGGGRSYSPKTAEVFQGGGLKRSLPTHKAPIDSSLRQLRHTTVTVVERGAHEPREQRVRGKRLALEFGVKLAADEVRVALELDHLDEI